MTSVACVKGLRYSVFSEEGAGQKGGQGMMSQGRRGQDRLPLRGTGTQLPQGEGGLP